MEFSAWNSVHGIQYMEFSAWNSAHGIQRMEFSTWNLAHEIQCMGIQCMEFSVHGIQSVEFSAIPISLLDDIQYKSIITQPLWKLTAIILRAQSRINKLSYIDVDIYCMIFTCYNYISVIQQLEEQKVKRTINFGNFNTFIVIIGDWTILINSIGILCTAVIITQNKVSSSLLCHQCTRRGIQKHPFYPKLSGSPITNWPQRMRTPCIYKKLHGIIDVRFVDKMQTK